MILCPRCGREIASEHERDIPQLAECGCVVVTQREGYVLFEPSQLEEMIAAVPDRAPAQPLVVQAPHDVVLLAEQLNAKDFPLRWN